MLGFGKRDLFDTLYGSGAPGLEPAQIPVIPVSSLGPAEYRTGYHDGEKYPGGFGATSWPLITDYWTLRARSAQLYKTNIYARGLLRRLVTNVINTGLHLEATPEEKILGLEEDALADWSELVENRFELWGADPRLCDNAERMTFGALQAQAWMEALVSGDVLVLLKQDQRTRLPRIELVSGSLVQTPMNRVFQSPGKNRVVHGVELDSANRHVAYWVRQTDGTTKRLPAVGEKSGKRLAWMFYGTDRRLDDVRGEPLLSIALQSLNEIDRYRESTQRKATINSMIATYITKAEPKPGTRAITGGAVRRGTDSLVGSDGKERSFKIAGMVPGLVIQELQQGEEPRAFPSTGTDEKFGDFEAAIIAGTCMALEIPPEIGVLSFRNNYSASQAAINEFKMFLNKERTRTGSEFCQPVYEDWLLATILSRKIEAQSFLDAWRNPAQRDIVSAWQRSDWSGHIKPAVDLSKLVDGYERMVEQGFITRDRASRELTGTKYAKNIQTLRLENEQLLDANKSLAELERMQKPERSTGEGSQNRPGRPRKDDNQDDDERDDEDSARVLRLLGR